MGELRMGEVHRALFNEFHHRLDVEAVVYMPSLDELTVLLEDGRVLGRITDSKGQLLFKTPASSQVIRESRG